MKVEIWSDFACPFCYIGKVHFETALAQFEHRDEVDVVYRSFELDPQAPLTIEEDIHTLMAKKYGMTRDRAMALNHNIVEMAKEAGLTFAMDSMILTNTFDAHRLAQYATQNGKMDEMAKTLFQAYFTDSRHLGDRATLLELAASIGLSHEDVDAVLAKDDYASAVREDERVASELGISGVPFFVIDRKYGISGAQPAGTFLEALESMWKETHQPLTVLKPKPSSADAKEDGCADGVCAVKETQ